MRHLRRSEQLLMAELAGRLLLQVLEPMQAATLLVALWPAPCDPILLLHSLLRAECAEGS
jgi:hypothetical protein